MKHIKTLVLCLIITIFCISCSVPSFAFTSSVDFGDAEECIFNPESTDLFSNFKDIMPGDVKSQNIVIANTSANTDKTIYLKVSVNEADKDFLQWMSISVVYNEDVIAENLASEEGNLGEWVSLGQLAPGEQRTITVILTVDKAMNNEQALKQGLIKWFFATEDTVREDTTHTSATNKTSATNTNADKTNPNGKSDSTKNSATKTNSDTGTTKAGKLPYTGSTNMIPSICAINILCLTAIIVVSKKKHQE